MKFQLGYTQSDYFGQMKSNTASFNTIRRIDIAEFFSDHSVLTIRGLMSLPLWWHPCAVAGKCLSGEVWTREWRCCDTPWAFRFSLLLPPWVRRKPRAGSAGRAGGEQEDCIRMWLPCLGMLSSPQYCLWTGTQPWLSCTSSGSRRLCSAIQLCGIRF